MYKIAICLIATISFSYNTFKFCTIKSADKKIRAIHLIYNLPTVNWDSSIINMNNTYDVFYYKDYIMYRFPYLFDSTVEGKLVLQEERPNYFVFHRDSISGYNYYPRPDPAVHEGKLPVDSVLKYTFQSTAYDSFFSWKPDSSYYDAEGNLLNVYNYAATIKYPENFTYYFYYSKNLKDIRETFSKKMDGIKNRKLFKIRIIAHGAYYKEYNMTFPQRETLLEMKEVSLQNKDEILTYFNKYKQGD
jgi:hypothetical protein